MDTSKTPLTEAINLYIQASKLDIESPERKDMLTKAVTILEQHIEKNPKSMEAHRKLIGVLILQKHYSKAVRVMQSAITLSPEDPKLFIGLAFLYEHSRNYEFASHMLGQALKLDPDNKMAKDYKVHIKNKIKLLDEMTGHQQNPHSSASPHAKMNTNKPTSLIAPGLQKN
ncbi:MAG: tetratricopeptide repeat protein [Gammaproteobacteria bacterium]|nr:tetratricopeptide repeat protein [Gammaproteobacteria bacterium]